MLSDLLLFILILIIYIYRIRNFLLCM